MLVLGNLPVWALVSLGGILTTGWFRAVEGAQNIAYGRNVDITTELVNVLENLMDEDAYNIALNIGHIAVNAFFGL